MNKNLARVVAEIFSKPLDSEELPAKILRLGDEIRKVALADETMLGKYRDLLASFEPIIPDERQRCRAALQALCTTAKLSRQQILRAAGDQIEELKSLEKEAVPAKSTWRDAMKGSTARLQQLKGEIGQLREKLAKLESEEQTLLAGMSRQESDLAQAEKAVKDLFAAVVEEAATLCGKIAEASAEVPAAPVAATAAPPQPAAPKTPPPRPEPPKAKAPKIAATYASRSEARPEQVPPLQETKYQRKCPMCGGSFNRLEFEKTWQCYVCAYEEPDQD
jgi:predicted  nucleic acid-binding Zn-ribbon protein